MHDPLQYGGIGTLKYLALQDKWGIYYFPQTLQLNVIIARNVLATINDFQVLSGFVCQVMEVPLLSIDYIVYRQMTDPRPMCMSGTGSTGWQDAGCQFSGSADG